MIRQASILAAVLTACLAIGSQAAFCRESVQFARDVRPILSEHCYACHGPDGDQRQADLRLDTHDDLLGVNRDAPIVVPGDPDASEILRRVESQDPDYRMPPAARGAGLSAAQIATLRSWVAAGATWQPHWSFVTPQRPDLPPPHTSSWVRNQIDSFVLSRLAANKLSPAPAADKATLLRRVALDLTGLPPTTEVAESYLGDNKPGAYARLVDRLLNGPRYGERMTAVWLDAARYADTKGYQDDGEVNMWRWRDWVINAFNGNMPFDQFTIEQLAGDLLPNPTLEQMIATGFNRNHRTNAEGGVIPEEFRVEYVADRVDTTATVWLGLTLVCARCHEHKFDPISQREFYQLFAFFNNVDEDGRGRKIGNTPPVIAAPTAEQQHHHQQLLAEVASARHAWQQAEPELAAAQQQWEASLDDHAIGPAPAQFPTHSSLEACYTMEDFVVDAQGKAEKITVHRGPAQFGDSPIGRALLLDGRTYVDIGESVGNFSDDETFSFAMWIRPRRFSGVVLSRLEIDDDPTSKGYAVSLRDGHVRLHLVQQWADDAIRVETERRVALDDWTHIAVSYDGTSTADGVRIYLDGTAQPLRIEIDSLFQGFAANNPVRIGRGGDPDNQYVGSIDELRIYDEVLPPDEVVLLATPHPVGEILQISSELRTANQRQKLRAYYLAHAAGSEFTGNERRLRSAERRLRQFTAQLPTVMVMREQSNPRSTFVHVRGQYDQLGERVTASVPAVLPPLAGRDVPNRLDLARWLVRRDHPLTARVFVNRVWQMSFGVGLVKTAEDFGAQGDPPSHPRLLDWLATEFVASGWNVKALRRLIVTSATYRQTSRAAPRDWAADPENRLLARGPRFRLPAESIRDQALALSGLYVERLGGPAVRPYQPAGLWEELSDATYVQDHGEELYRRSLYTIWKRTAPPPAMTVFDAVSRETCIVREERTNTPLQALTLMNETGFVEAARALAEQLVAESTSVRQTLRDAWQRVTGRLPHERELDLLLKSWQQYVQHYRDQPQEAERLVSVGEKRSVSVGDLPRLAALTAVVNMLLNLDETVTMH